MQDTSENNSSDSTGIDSEKESSRKKKITRRFNKSDRFFVEEENQENIVESNNPIKKILRKVDKRSVDAKSPKIWFKKTGDKIENKKEVLAAAILEILLQNENIDVAKYALYKEDVISQKVGFDDDKNTYSESKTLHQLCIVPKELRKLIKENNDFAYEITALVLYNIIIGNTDVHWDNIMLISNPRKNSEFKYDMVSIDFGLAFEGIQNADNATMDLLNIIKVECEFPIDKIAAQIMEKFQNKSEEIFSFMDDFAKVNEMTKQVSLYKQKITSNSNIICKNAGKKFQEVYR